MRKLFILISAALLFAMILSTCVNPTKQDGFAKATSSDLIAAPSDLNLQDENENYPITITDIADWDKLNLENHFYDLHVTTNSGWFYNSVYEYLKALITNDAETLLNLTVNDFRDWEKIDDPQVFDCYKTFSIDSYAITCTENGQIYFDVDISANESGSSEELERFTEGHHSFWFENVYHITSFLADKKYHEQNQYLEFTPAFSHIFTFLCRSGGDSKAFDFYVNSGGFESPDANWAMIYYLASMYGDDYYLSAKELNELAKKYFNVSDFVPIGNTSENQMYTIQALGCPSPLCKNEGETTDDDGNTIITLQFYVDAMMTIKSHKIQYALKQLEDDTQWQFISAEYLYRSPWRPFIVGPT